MEEDRTPEQLIKAFIEFRIFSDLKIIVFWLISAIFCIYVPELNETFLRVVFALPVVLFIPGYALIAALFPSNEDIDNIERIALSFGLSIAVVPLIGLALNYTPWGIRLDPIVISLVIFTVAMVIVAQYHRAIMPPEKQFFIPFHETVREVNDELFPEEQALTDRMLSIILILSILAAVGTTIFVIGVPKEGEKFTEFYILGEEGMAADYPTKFQSGEPQSLIIGIGNHEYRDVTYTVETHLMEQTFNNVTNTSKIHKMKLLDRYSVTVPHNETIEQDYFFTVDNTDYNRLQFLLFNETVPSDKVSGQDRIDAGYRDLHLWINVRSRQY